MQLAQLCLLLFKLVFLFPFSLFALGSKLSNLSGSLGHALTMFLLQRGSRQLHFLLQFLLFVCQRCKFLLCLHTALVRRLFLLVQRSLHLLQCGHLRTQALLIFVHSRVLLPEGLKLCLQRMKCCALCIPLLQQSFVCDFSSLQLNCSSIYRVLQLLGRLQMRSFGILCLRYRMLGVFNVRLVCLQFGLLKCTPLSHAATRS